MYKLTIDYETLFSKISNGATMIDEVIPASKQVFVKTPSGFSLINGSIKKSKQPIIRMLFDDNSAFECSEGHLFSCNGFAIRAKDAFTIDTTFGSKKVKEKIELGEEEVYDISIDAPHWYLHDSENTIIHHNTFFALSACKYFLDSDPNAVVLYFETESALTQDILISRRIDLKRFGILPIATVQEFKTQALKIVNKYLDDPKTPLMFVLDSLGNLSTTKEMEDSAAGADTRDMTRAQIIKATFRVLSLKLGAAGIPMVITNHVYDNIGAGPYASKEQSGGCLLPGTRVVMADKTLRNIEDISVGDKVLTLDGGKEVLTCWNETNLIEPEPECYRLTFDDETVVECSGNHRFMVRNEWVEAEKLKEGEWLDEF